MDSVSGTSDGNPFAALGQRMRQARRERGLTQEGLAAPEFTKGYISALERGAVRPSLKALELFARRLGVPLTDLLAPSPGALGAADPRAVEDELRSHGAYAAVLIRGNRVAQALVLIAEMERTAAPYADRLPAAARFLAPLLRGRAFLQQGEPGRARTFFEAALEIAADDADLATAARDMIGVSFYRQEQAQFALEQHLQCVRSFDDGAAKDPALRLSVFRNLANDYWALDDFRQATATYARAIASALDLTDLERQARASANLAEGYVLANDWVRASDYANRSLASYQAADTRATVASICLNLSEILLDEGRYDEVRQLLDQARDLLPAAGDETLLSFLHTYYAHLERREGNLEAAAEHANGAVLLAEAALGHADETSLRLRGGPRALAEALHIAALIEEARGNLDQAGIIFRRALEGLDDPDFQDSVYAIAFSYAEMLKNLGDFTQAVDYYRLAAQSHARQRRVLGS